MKTDSSEMKEKVSVLTIKDHRSKHTLGFNPQKAVTLGGLEGLSLVLIFLQL